MMEGGDFRRGEMITRLEWLGREFDEEIDRAWEDEFRDQGGDNQIGA